MENIWVQKVFAKMCLQRGENSKTLTLTGSVINILEKKTLK